MKFIYPELKNLGYIYSLLICSTYDRFAIAEYITPNINEERYITEYWRSILEYNLDIGADKIWAWNSTLQIVRSPDSINAFASKA